MSRPIREDGRGALQRCATTIASQRFPDMDLLIGSSPRPCTVSGRSRKRVWRSSEHPSRRDVRPASAGASSRGGTTRSDNTTRPLCARLAPSFADDQTLIDGADEPTRPDRSRRPSYCVSSMLTDKRSDPGATSSWTAPLTPSSSASSHRDPDGASVSRKLASVRDFGYLLGEHGARNALPRRAFAELATPSAASRDKHAAFAVPNFSSVPVPADRCVGGSVDERRRGDHEQAMVGAQRGCARDEE